MKDEILERIDCVRRNIARAAEKAGEHTPVTLVAATKTVGKEIVDKLPDWGIEDAGENRVQEFCEKYDPRIALKRHFIGALQTNKVKHLIGKCVLIQSVDRENLADEIDRLSEKNGVKTAVLLEVNMGREASKSGVLPEDLPALMRYARAKKHLSVRGIMAVMPIGAPDALYCGAKRLYDRQKDEYEGIDTLSMGMSGDYEKAVTYGSTMVRVGSAIFGPRDYAAK